jgi:hypothetical protein
MISARTKAAPAAAKRRGVKLGGDRGARLTARARAAGRAAVQERARKAGRWITFHYRAPRSVITAWAASVGGLILQWHQPKKRPRRHSRTRRASASSRNARPQLLVRCTRMVSIPARTLRAGAVLAPEFIARNPVRDQFTALAFSDGYPPPWEIPPCENTPLGKYPPAKIPPSISFACAPKTPPLLVREPPAFCRTPGSLRGWLISQATWPTLGPDRLPAGGP